jgi:hypothetical protein
VAVAGVAAVGVAVAGDFGSKKLAADKPFVRALTGGRQRTALGHKRPLVRQTDRNML